MASISFTTKYPKSVEAGAINEKWNVNSTRILGYNVDFWQKDLGLHKHISAPELYLLELKVQELMTRWDKLAAATHHKAKLAQSKETCDAATTDAVEKLEALSSILIATLKVDDRVDWEQLKDKSSFNGNPKFPELRPARNPVQKPFYFPPDISFIDVILGRKAQRIAEAADRHQKEEKAWGDSEAAAELKLAENIAAWEKRKQDFTAKYEESKAAFLKEQKEHNDRVDALARGVATGDQVSVIEHAGLVLEASDYGELFEKSFNIDYQPASKTLLVEYELPSPDAMPTLKSVKFNASTGEVKETHIAEREQKANFDSVCYQICLRTIHELIEADDALNYDAVLFNGFTTAVNKATGKDTHSCIMSVLVKRSDFEAIDLARVEPKACFKSLKGVSASSLSALASVPPVMEINTHDKRFIDAKAIADGLDDSTNLASMDWSDFEHLIRELFEKELAMRGGQVKVTQSSSDGGVDAVAFDPDPIMGGKIVIQAKRYTRTVGVSAVRDLYGTMQHEGASKGILISTADFGPDAYQFSAGKPITLLTGSNLLHMLEKHGYRAKIDIQAARKELNLRQYTDGRN